MQADELSLDDVDFDDLDQVDDGLAGRLARPGATPDVHHGLLEPAAGVPASAPGPRSAVQIAALSAAFVLLMLVGAAASAFVFADRVARLMTQ
jgi:hypothetical protein